MKRLPLFLVLPLILLGACNSKSKSTSDGDKADTTLATTPADSTTPATIGADSLSASTPAHTAADKSSTNKGGARRVEVSPGVFEKWYSQTENLAGRNVTFHYSPNEDESFFKVFGETDGSRFYYNNRHGYFVWLPKGLGYNQVGEAAIGAHDNQYANADNSLVLTAYAMYYDILLEDEPDYAKTLYADEKKYLKKSGTVTFVQNKSDLIVAKGRLKEPEYPNSNNYIHKWLLKKDIEGRECEISLTVYYADSLSHREQEFMRIINQFPDVPWQKK